MTLMARKERIACRTENSPIRSGHTTPQATPASVQPVSVRPAMAYGKVRARRRTRASSAPLRERAHSSSGRRHRRPIQSPTAPSRANEIAKNASSPGP